MPSRDIVGCFRPGFYGRELLVPRSLLQPCGHLLLVCSWVALPFAIDFFVSNGGTIFQHDVRQIAQTIETHIPPVELQIVEGNATFATLEARSQALDFSHGLGDDMLRVELPGGSSASKFYSLFEDPGGGLKEYLLDFCIHRTLRYFDSGWNEVSDYHVGTPVEFVPAEVVEVQPGPGKLWRSATIVTGEPATKLNKYSYTLKFGLPAHTPAGSEIPVPGHPLTENEKKDAPGHCSVEAGRLPPEVPNLRAGQIWAGSYVCGQGATDFTLQLTKIEDLTGSKSLESADTLGNLHADVWTSNPDESYQTGTRLSVMSLRGVWRVGIVREVKLLENDLQIDLTGESGQPENSAGDSERLDGTHTSGSRSTRQAMLYIHYDGFDEKWDEWISVDSQRFGRQQSMITAQFFFNHVLAKLNCSGSFHVIGQLRGGHLILHPLGTLGSHEDGWINNPCNFSSIGIGGSLNTTVEHFGTFTGDVYAVDNACSKFSAWLRPLISEFDIQFDKDWVGYKVGGMDATLQVAHDGMRFIPHNDTALDATQFKFSSTETPDEANPENSNSTTKDKNDEESSYYFASAPSNKAGIMDHIWELVNTNDDNELDEAEIQAAMQMLGFDDRRIEVHDETEAMDADGDELVSQEEFVSWLLDNIDGSDSDGSDGLLNFLVDSMLKTRQPARVADPFFIQYKRLKSWVTHDDYISLKLKVYDADGVSDYLSLKLISRESTAIADTLRNHINFFLMLRGESIIKPKKQKLTCPSDICDIRTTPARIRRNPAIVFTPDKFMLNTSAWASLRAAVVVTPTSLYLLEGFSHHYGAYWRYDGEEEGNDGKPDYPLTEENLKRHAPLWIYTYMLCETGPRGGRRVKGSPTLNMRCSPEIARTRVTQFIQSAERFGFGILLSSSLHALVLSVVVWLLHIMQLFISHMLLFVFIYLPSSYIAVNLIRHVDTPAASVRVVATVAAYAYTPSLIVNDLLALFWTRCESYAGTSVVSDHALSVIKDVLDAFYWQMAIYLAWSCFIFIRVRALSEQEARAEMLKARGPRPEIREPTNADPNEDYGDPMCRICFGDQEDGRLISPCLCKGSMRYVHVDCLNQWRHSSANAQSFFLCDNCMFRYSFKRTRYAQLLRSALVVNFVALIIFALIIVLMGYISILLDYAFFDGDLSTYFTPDFNSEQLAEILQAMDAESPSDLWFNQISILGLDFMQLVTGACLVGVTGFVSSGFLGAMIWGRRENGMLLLAILFGLIHSFGKVYGKVKDKSAKLLAMAESQIVDVGQGAPPKRPPPADTTPDIGLDICSYYRAGVEPNLSHYYRSKEVTQLPNEVVPPPNVKTHTGADSPLPEDNLEIETMPDEIPARHGADSPLPENNLEIETVPDEVPARHQDFADSYRNSYDRLLGGLDQDQPLQAAA